MTEVGRVTRRKFLKAAGVAAAPVEVAHHSIIPAYLGNIAMILRRTLKWDPETEQFPGDAEANRMLSRAYRAPWRL